MTKRKYRDLGRNPVTGEKIYDWDAINHNVAVTQAETNLEFEQHRLECEARYSIILVTLPGMTDKLLAQLAALQQRRRSDNSA